MNHTWVWLTVGVCVSALAAALPAQHEPTEAAEAVVTVEVVGLSVTADDENEEYTSYGRPEGLAENVVPGTAVYFVAHLDQDALLEVLPGESVIEAFTDSTGEVLLEAGSASREGINGLRGVDENSGRTGFRFMIASEQTPAEGATSLHLAGTLALTVRGEAQTAISDEVSLVKGTTFQLAEREITVETADVSDDSTAINLVSSVNFETLGDVRFFDADGNQIAAEDGGTSQMTANDVVTHGQEFRLEGAHQAVTIEVDYFDPVPVSVPIDVTVGLGL